MEPKHANIDYSGIQFCQIFRKEEKPMTVPTEQVAIILVVEGSLIIEGKSGNFPISQGGGYIMKQFNSYTIRRANDDPFDGILCFVEANTICQIIRSFDRAETLPRESRANDELFIAPSQNLLCFIQSLKLYLPLAHSQHDLKIISESKLYELFWLLKQSVAHDEFNAFLRGICKPEKLALDYLLEKYYRENISLKSLAHLAGCSISTFKRKFEHLYQTTPGKWIQTRRLEEAYHLIHTSDKTISEICFEVGFENPSHFIQTFKSKFGITPKQLQYKLNAA